MDLKRAWHRAAIVVVSIALTGAVLRAQSDDDVAKKDSDAVQGKWSTKTKNPQGKQIEVVKEVTGNKETVSTIDDGQVIYSHTNDVKLSRSGRVKLFTYSNMQITVGANRGAKVEIERSYVYNVVRLPNGKEAIVEVHGMLTDGPEQDEPVNVLVWERVAK